MTYHSEQKSQHICNLEVKSLTGEGYFSGYASVYNITDNHNDIIINGAFAKSINNGVSDIKLLWQHDTSQPIGSFTYINEDEYGLYVEGRLMLNLVKAREAFSLLNEGVVESLSVGFQVEESNFDYENNIRYIIKAKLFEISLVTFPANDQAKIISVGKKLAKTKINSSNNSQQLSIPKSFKPSKKLSSKRFSEYSCQVSTLERSLDKALAILSL